MILKAPASYDIVMAYENLALDWMEAAKSRTNTGGFQLIYPKRNLWNDNPYYILDAPWSSEEHKKNAFNVSQLTCTSALLETTKRLIDVFQMCLHWKQEI